jgi:uncharacterized protein YbjT (DUF2867 family)
MILVTGGTGFVGGYLIRRLRQEGLPVRALARHPDRAQPLKDLGVEVVPGDILEKVSLEKAAEGVDRVIHLVGIIQETPGVTFRGIHVEGTRHIIEAARKAGVRHFFHQSALGTRPGAKSEYHRTKWEAEELVRQSGIPHTILRPSLIYGAGDKFTIRLSEILRRAPVMPVIGSGKSRVQPIYIDDVVSCMVKVVTGDAFLNEIYEIGGPDQLTFKEMTTAIAEIMGLKRPAFHVPLFFMKPIARALETMLSNPPLTTDQLIMLQEDNVCGMKDIRDAFGIEPLEFREGLRKFIRPVSG